MKCPAIALFLLSLSACVPVSTQTTTSSSKNLVFRDFNYEPAVGLVQVYPASQDEQAILEYPVVAIDGEGIRMTFDLLEENYRYINARYIHCNADWSKSYLADIQFLDQYNEFTINNYEYSSNTRIPYVWYSVDLPTPKVSGNYLIAVYNEGNENDLLFVRRFCVYQPTSSITAEFQTSSIIAKRQNNHQLRLSVSYERISNPNPLQDFKLVLLQNHNWNTAITDLKPTQIGNAQRYIEYNHFSGENNFAGLNEFRFFDLRSIDYRGMNVRSIEKGPSGVEAIINLDKQRSNLAYTQINEDLNGAYYLQNTDPGDTQMQSEYVNVHFQLVSGEEIPGEVFIAGELTNWNMTPEAMMHYDPNSGLYKGTLQLKQGYYNYLYIVRSPTVPADYIEGSNYQTDNFYEVLFYYRDPAKNYDELIGYRKLSSRN